ncbi:MAG: ATP-dependent DNA helicase RecG [Propionibacteriaceae bacterium]|nr:ATP-dependent DNA helicase RecG [Propionibacteriaceae bacterium]
MTTWKTKAFQDLAVPLTKAIGPESAQQFLKLNCETCGDLLRLLPRHFMSGTELTDIRSLIARHQGDDEYVALLARISNVHIKGEFPRQRVEVTLSDGHGSLTATFFGQKKYLEYWQRLLSRSERGIFAGKIGWFRNYPQLTHPAFAMVTKNGFLGNDEAQEMATAVGEKSFIGLYPQTSKLMTWVVAKSIKTCLGLISGLEDPLPRWVRDKAEVSDLLLAFHQVHTPMSKKTYDKGVQRLLFDEAFATQVAMAYRRQDSSKHTAIPRLVGPDGLLTAFDAHLPFTLTHEQIEIGKAITEDLGKTRPMQRLLQGEVGSGKTVVALRAMLTVADAGGQAVLLAPTEVLAVQHAYTVMELMGELTHGDLITAGPTTDVVLLTGSMTAAAKGAAIAKITSGEAGIIIGTHALLSKGVQFADLGLVVVDEQHRFGVEQRNALADQGTTRPHILVMTATPIPRSVAMTIFGDLDMSTLVEIPAGRAQVTTTVVDVKAKPAWVDRAWERVREEVARGRQVFVVAPKIDPTDKNEGTSVVEAAGMLTAGPLAGLRLAVLHSRLPTSEKTDIMARFTAGEIDVLVATSMIEVGVDQPNASMMVVFDAERFGISQLHQLRGRIGRGEYPGVCILLTQAEEETPARERLEAVAQTRDGFELAKADLAQRREGDVLGMNQSGRRSSLRLLKVLEHGEIIDLARGLAEEVVRRDPLMTDPGIADYVADVEARAQADLIESA